MKKYLIYFIILLVFIITSCDDNLTSIPNDESDNTDNSQFSFVESSDIPITYNVINGGAAIQYSNGYLFFNNNYNRDIYNFPENRTMMKYNLKTNNLISVCTDPICLHNTKECPFYGMYQTMYVFDEKILYTQLYADTTESDEFVMNGQFQMYNTKTGERVVRNKISTSNYSEYMKILAMDNDVFYYDYTYNDEYDKWIYSICKWDLNKNQVVTIAGDNNVYDSEAEYPDILGCNFLFTVDSRIYFSDGKTIYSTDKNYENKLELFNGSFLLDVYTDGEYIYYGVPIEKGSLIQSLHRVDFDGKNYIDLGIVTEQNNVSITENYIYYKKYDEVIIGKNMVRGYSGENIVLYNSEIWRCDHNGSNHELIYKFDDDMENFRTLYECYIGNYIYALYDWWEDSDGDDVFKDGDHHSSTDNNEYKIMRIDINSGEIYYINGIK